MICGRAFYSLPKLAVIAITPQELDFTAFLGKHVLGLKKSAVYGGPTSFLPSLLNSCLNRL